MLKNCQLTYYCLKTQVIDKTLFIKTCLHVRNKRYVK